MDNVYRISWEGCPPGVTAYVIDEPLYGTSLEQAIRPLIGKYRFSIWNTKPRFGNATDFNDWRGQCVDVIASFEKTGTIYKLDPAAIQRGMVQPEYHKNVWAYVPEILKKLVRQQDPKWAETLQKKWSN